MKAGVEYGHLWNFAKTLLDNVDPFHLGTIMQWCKDGHARDCRFHFRCDGGGLLGALATAHNTMTYHVDFGRCRKYTQIYTP